MKFVFWKSSIAICVFEQRATQAWERGGVELRYRKYTENFTVDNDNNNNNDDETLNERNVIIFADSEFPCTRLLVEMLHVFTHFPRNSRFQRTFSFRAVPPRIYRGYYVYYHVYVVNEGERETRRWF